MNNTQFRIIVRLFEIIIVLLLRLAGIIYCASPKTSKTQEELDTEVTKLIDEAQDGNDYVRQGKEFSSNSEIS